MSPDLAPSRTTPADEIKLVPADAAARESIRAAAAQRPRIASGSEPDRHWLEEQAAALLADLSLPRTYLGFAMVEISNCHWRQAFDAVPFARRLCLLPHCLSNRTGCSGRYDSVGLHCAGCGGCNIHGLKAEAERLGYTVIVAEGTSSVLMNVIEGHTDALLGVACLDSLEKSFHRIADLGIPHLAVPLLRDGCRDTELETALVISLLRSSGTGAVPARRSFVPLLRQTATIFHEPRFTQLVGQAAAEHPESDPGFALTRTVGLDWLRDGGKRLRPFITLAAAAVARHGMAALSGDADIDALLSPAAQRVAVAIEALHKASLVHDDIEDNDEWRYGRRTVHREHGLATAINVGDYLIGLGYQLIAAGAADLGSECAADILRQLSHAHLELCRGQGAELTWQKNRAACPRPLDLLAMYALKTAPAFEAALHAGLRAAGVTVDSALLRRYSTYLGEAFQIMNDLDDWQADDRNKITRGLDATSGRPTLLRAFASESDGGAAFGSLVGDGSRSDPAALLERIHALYIERGVFDKAQRLLVKLRTRAAEAAGQFPSEDLRQLMHFFVRMMLPEKSWSESTPHSPRAAHP